MSLIKRLEEATEGSRELLGFKVIVCELPPGILMRICDDRGRVLVTVVDDLKAREER